MALFWLRLPTAVGYFSSVKYARGGRDGDIFKFVKETGERLLVCLVWKSADVLRDFVSLACLLVKS